jgi:hypothetical protein
LLDNEAEESWLRIRALVALSFLQRPDLVEDSLTNGCVQAYKNLNLNSDLAYEPPRTRITEMHAALFAVGDCFGVARAQSRARNVREVLHPILTELAHAKEPRAGILHRAARAAAYLLTLTAQPREGGVKDISQELLELFRQHTDPVTARLSRWALDHRFAPDGSVKPLLDAADTQPDSDAPGPRG